MICWGDNDYGQCRVPAGLTNIVAITCGGDVTMAVTTERRIIAWGNNQYDIVSAVYPIIW
jgi:hypothetical protein